MVDGQVARAVYDLRTESGLTQATLAERIGTTPSVISRLEDAAYRGHSLALLRRIASALGHRIEVRFIRLQQPAVRERNPRIARKRVATDQAATQSNARKRSRH